MDSSDSDDDEGDYGSSDSDDDEGDYGLSADAAATLLVSVRRRPVVRHPGYPRGPDGAHCGTTADGDALLCARGNGMRALESASLSAVLCGLPSLSAAVRLAGMCAGSGNPLWLWSLASEQRPTTNECYARYVRCIYASGQRIDYCPSPPPLRGVTAIT